MKITMKITMKPAFWFVLTLALSPVDFAAGQSLEDIVRESEQTKGGEANPALPDVPKSTPSERALPPSDSTPPGGIEEDPAGRVPALPSAWGFVMWRSSGQRLSGQLRDSREECEDALEGYRDAQPDLFFSPCILVRADRRTL